MKRQNELNGAGGMTQSRSVLPTLIDYKALFPMRRNIQNHGTASPALFTRKQRLNFRRVALIHSKRMGHVGVIAAGRSGRNPHVWKSYKSTAFNSYHIIDSTWSPSSNPVFQLSLQPAILELHYSSIRLSFYHRGMLGEHQPQCDSLPHISMSRRASWKP